VVHCIKETAQGNAKVNKFASELQSSRSEDNVNTSMLSYRAGFAVEAIMTTCKRHASVRLIPVILCQWPLNCRFASGAGEVQHQR